MRPKAWISVFAIAALVATACGDDDGDSADDGGDTGSTEAAAATTEASGDAEETTADTAGDDAPDATDAAPEETTEDTADDSSGDDDGGAPSGDFDVDAVLGVDLDACEAEPTGDPLVIGYAADLSEVGGFVDIPGSAAAEAFIELVNCAGGVGGVPVDYVVEDIQGDPDVTQRAAQDLLDSGVHAILGPPFADFGQPLLQVTAGDVPVLFVASTEPSLPDPAALSYLVTFDDTVQATVAAEFALEQGWDTAVTLSAEGPYFGYNPEVFTEVFEEGGGTVVGDYSYVPFDDTDFSTQANEIAGLSEPPDVLYTAMIADQFGILRGQLEGQGVTDLNYIGADAFEATGIIAQGDAAEGVYYTTHAFAGDGNRLETFVERYEEITGEPIENSSFGGLAADSVILAIQAFLASGELDGAAIGAAIAELADVETVTGTTTYVDTFGVPEKPVFIHQIVGGEVTLAETAG